MKKEMFFEEYNKHADSLVTTIRNKTYRLIKELKESAWEVRQRALTEMDSKGLLDEMKKQLKNELHEEEWEEVTEVAFMQTEVNKSINKVLEMALGELRSLTSKIADLESELWSFMED